MPLRKLTFKPGINREVTRYANEAGWYEGDKIRFREGLPEKIGGWKRVSNNTFLGVCRSLNPWANNEGTIYTGVGTNLKFYVSLGAQYFDVTPIRATTSAGELTISATAGSNTVVVTDVDHGASNNDFVVISGAVSLGGNITADVLNQEHQIKIVLTDNTYEIELGVTANSSDTGNGGASIIGEYQVNTGPEIVNAISGWGGGSWSLGSWGFSESSTQPIRIWNQANFGEDLIISPKGGALYYWDVTGGTQNNRAVRVDSLAGASDVPLIANYIITSDIFRFVFAFGTNLLGESTVDDMFVRWSDQEDVTLWTPQATNQAGSLRLSKGSRIVSAIQSRQEILVFTDAALYSFQYVGAPAVWGAQLVGSNISIASQNARIFANGVTYWMGKDNFYQYDGRVQAIRCDIRRYIFDDINREQYEQVFAGTVEAFNEVWFYYCSSNSTTIDKYVIYNYVDDIWAYGTLARTAWADSGLLDFPIAATYTKNIVEHENGVDDNETSSTQPISAYIQSGEFDLEDGDRVMFVWRCMPDLNFSGSTSMNPTVTMTFQPRYSSGGAYNNPLSEGGVAAANATRNAVVPVEQYTPQLNIRVRGRQMAMRIESNTPGTQWQCGTPRLEMRPDGRR